MKLLLLSLIVATANAGFAGLPTASKTTALNAATGFDFFKPIFAAKSSTYVPVAEVKKMYDSDDERRLSGINKRYTAKDGSTILGPSFRLAMEIALMAPVIYALHLDNGAVDQAGLLGAGFHVALAGWIGLQANRVRAVFDDKAIEFYNLKGMGSSYLAKEAMDPRLQRKPGNWLVEQSPNRWNYETITGYRFYPAQEFPVVCIMWESETGEGRKAYGNDQPHFFPLLFNAAHFKEEMTQRNVPYV